MKFILWIFIKCRFKFNRHFWLHFIIIVKYHDLLCIFDHFSREYFGRGWLTYTLITSLLELIFSASDSSFLRFHYFLNLGMDSTRFRICLLNLMINLIDFMTNYSARRIPRFWWWMRRCLWFGCRSSPLYSKISFRFFP